MDDDYENDELDEENDHEDSIAEYEYPVLSNYWMDNKYYVRNLIHAYLKMPKDPDLRVQMMKVENLLLHHALTPARDDIAINRLAGWIADWVSDDNTKSDYLEYRRAEKKVNENIYVAADPNDRRFDDIDLSLGVELDSNKRKQHWLKKQGLAHLIQIMGGIYGGRDGLHSQAVLDFLAFFRDSTLMLDPGFNVALIPSTITQSMYLVDGKGVRCCVPDAIGVLYDLVPDIVEAKGTRLGVGGSITSPYRPYEPRTFPAFGNSVFLQFEIQLTNYDRLVDKLQKNLSLNAEETTKYHIYPLFIIKEEEESRSAFLGFESVLETLTSILPDSHRKDRLKFFNLISFNTFNRQDVMTLDWPQRSQHDWYTPSYRILRYGEH